MRNRGFTVVELMIALLILAILAAIAVPSFRDFIGNSKVTGSTNDLVTAINIARSTALQRATPVTVCASTDQSTCSGALNWATGWIAFTDGDGAAGALDGLNDRLLQVWPAVTGDMVASGNASFIRYDMTGTTRTPVDLEFEIYQNGCSGRKRGVTTINFIGSVRSTKENCP